MKILDAPLNLLKPYHLHHKETKTNRPLLRKFEKSTAATSQTKKNRMPHHVTANTMRLQRIFPHGVFGHIYEEYTSLSAPISSPSHYCLVCE